LNSAPSASILKNAGTLDSACSVRVEQRSAFLNSHTKDPKVQRLRARTATTVKAAPKVVKSTGAAKSPSKSVSSKAAGAKLAADRKKTSAMLALVLKSLDEDKAEDVVSIDLAGKTPMADFMVVASGRSQRHVGAVADHLVRRLKEEGLGTARVEGMKQGDWVLIDGGDVVIHVFRPEVREFYKLEKMWSANIPADQIAV
jgi:ribosome-associated protein